MRTLRHRGLVLALVAVAMIATAAFANVFLLDFAGYDYWDPFTMPIDTIGNCYNAVGMVPQVNDSYLTFDYSLNEYTFSLQGVCLSAVDTVGTRVVYGFTGGTFDVYCDLLAGGTAADYGTNPPNATAPSSFEDGECVLGGDLSNFEITVDMGTGNADLYGNVTLVRGTQLGNIPVEQRNGWTLAGLRAGAPGTPDGYFWQIDGQLFIDAPVPVEESSWGSLKKTGFRGGN